MADQAAVDNTPLEDIDVITRLKGDLVSYRTDIAERNYYINDRDEYLYGDGLWQHLNIPIGYDRTFHNYLLRIIDIHTSQIMGQPFSVYSHYETQDTSQFDPKNDAAQIKQIQIKNRMNELKAVGRQQAIKAMIRDNGGHRLFMDGARTGSAYGSTLLQMWYDKDAKKIRIVNLESIQNWFPIWGDNNFRERMGDAYVWQIALEKANVEYGKFLDGSETWPVTYAGDPLINLQGSSSALTNQPGETTSSASTRRPMVTMIDYTGYLAGIAYNKQGKFVQVSPGKETKLSFRIVGDKIVSRITEEKYMPRFYYVPNRVVPRRPYGESDLPRSALDICQTILQLKSDQITLANKELFPMLKGKNYENASLPKRKPRETGFIPMQADQDVEVLSLPTNNLQAYEAIIQDRMNDLLAVTAVPRMMFFDTEPTTGSNQAAMTSLRPIIDVVETKQKAWEPELVKMFTDALYLAAEYDKNLKAVVDDDSDWWLYARWSDALRKEDPAHQSMLINDLRAGVLSVESYMEARGYLDTDKEINRIEQDLSDKVKSAILGGKLGELAQFTIFEKLGIPLYGFNQPKITLKGDLTPQQEGNLASNQGFNEGPFGSSIGPQGQAGAKADENVVNSGMVNYPGANPYAKYGTPAGIQPGQQINPANPQGQAGPAAQPATESASSPQGGQSAPIVTPGQNQPAAQPMSMPGSGVTTTTPAGEVAHTNQKRGK